MAPLATFALDGISFALYRRGVEMWVEGSGHRYPVAVITHPDPDDPTRTAVWIEIADLICFPGRLGVAIP